METEVLKIIAENGPGGLLGILIGLGYMYITKNKDNTPTENKERIRAVEDRMAKVETKMEDMESSILKEIGQIKNDQTEIKTNLIWIKDKLGEIN